MAEEADRADRADRPDQSDPVEVVGPLANDPRPSRRVLTAGLAVLATLVGLNGWLGYRDFQSRYAEQVRGEMVEAARQGAINLTTIDHEHVDEDVQRILDSSTGAFRDDFAARESIVEMLSYRPDTAETKLNAARDRLTGPFLESYNQLIQTVVIPGAKQKKITAAAQVPAAAPISSSADHAVVLAYVDQSLAVGSAAPTRTNSSVRVTMEKLDGRWLIAGFDPI